MIERKFIGETILGPYIYIIYDAEKTDNIMISFQRKEKSIDFTLPIDTAIMLKNELEKFINEQRKLVEDAGARKED